MSSPSLPRQIHRYEILSELGRGSTGRVYLARDPRIDRRVALKVLRRERLRGGDAGETRRRFLREARAAGGLAHDGIVTVYDADTDPHSGCPYLAMEWVPGGSLRSLLRRESRLPIARAVALAAQVARALDYAHARDVVHRDVKPANLLLAGDGAGRVKIVDFGIARLQSHSITLPGRMLGSPYYMSPEQVAGRAVDGRSDLFALGAVLYETLTGRIAFRDDSVGAVTHKVLTAEPRPIEHLRPEVPPSLRAVVTRALAKLPHDRFQTGAELAAALDNVGAELVLGVRARIRPGAAWSNPRAGGEEAGPGQVVEPQARASGAAGQTPTAATAEVSETLPLSGTTLIVARSAAATPAKPAPRSLSPAMLAALLLLGILLGTWPARLATPEAELLVMDSRALDRAPPIREAPPAPPEAAPAKRPPPDPGTAREGEAPAAAESASLDILYENRLRHAVLSVRVDGEETLAVELRTKNPLTRVAGQKHRWAIPVAAGERRVEVRIAGVSKRLEVRKEVLSIFAPAEARRLRVELAPDSPELTLAWLQ